MTTQFPEPTATTLHEQDYYLWLGKTAQLLRSGKLDELDLENLAEEIEDMGWSKRHTVESNLEIVLMHLLKYQYQPEKRSSNWRYTLLEYRYQLEQTLEESPSLKGYFEQRFAKSYQVARKLAAVETDKPISQFPNDCPFTPEQVLDLDYLPD